MKVKIYQPIKTPTQSGKKQKPWLIKIVEKENHKTIDPVMGWTSSDNTLEQLNLRFQSPEDAAKYASSQGFEYEIIKNSEVKIPKKSYADNFQ